MRDLKLKKELISNYICKAQVLFCILFFIYYNEDSSLQMDESVKIKCSKVQRKVKHLEYNENVF